MLIAILIIHSIVKLGELTQSFDLCRRTSTIINYCLIDLIRLGAVLAIVIGAVAIVNQVLSPNAIRISDSLT